jgi:hypothetical protein
MSEEEARRSAAIAAQAQRQGLSEWQLEAAMAVPSSLIREIINDHRRQPTKPAPEPPAVKAASGGTIPLGPRSKFEIENLDRLVARWVGGPNSVR